MTGFLDWKLFKHTLAPFDQSYVELAAFLAVFLLVGLAMALRTPGPARSRQWGRHLVQAASLFVFFFVVNSCLGVFGLIRNGLTGLGWTGKDDLRAFYWLGITVVVLAVTLHFGTAFCGWVCPTGTLQEWIGWLRKALRRSRLSRLSGLGLRAVGYAAGFGLFASGTFRAFSGRRPLLEDSAVFWASALLLITFLSHGWPRYDHALKRFRYVSLVLIVVLTVAGVHVTSPVHFVFTNVHDWASLLSTLVIMGASLAVARSWCRYLCPFGLLSSFAGRYAPRRVQLATNCRGCGHCEGICETAAIRRGNVDVSACTMCLKCVDECPHAALVAEHGFEPPVPSRSARLARRNAALFALVVLAASAPSPVPLHAQQSAPPGLPEWPSFRGGLANDAWREFALLPAPALDGWEFRPGDEVRGYDQGTTVFSSPSVAAVDGRALAFVGCYDRNLYAVDIATGAEVWRYTTGGAVAGAPAVARFPDRTLVLVGSADRTIYAVNAGTGRKVWGKALAPWRHTIGDAAVASPALFDLAGRKAVLFAYWLYDRSATKPLEVAEVRVCDAQTGRTIWQRTIGRSELSSPLVAQVNGRPLAFVASRDGNLYCLDAETSVPQWRHTAKEQIWASPTFARLAAGPTVFIGSRYGDMVALDAATGDLRWQRKIAREVDSTAAIADVDGQKVLFFGSQDQCLYGLRAEDGELLWKFESHGDVYSSPCVVPYNGRLAVAFAAGDDCVYLVSAGSGTEIWRTRPGGFLWAYRVLGESIWSSPVGVAIDGHTLLLVPFYDGVVHAYRLGSPRQHADAGDPAYGWRMLRGVLLSLLATAALAAVFIKLDVRARG